MKIRKGEVVILCGGDLADRGGTLPEGIVYEIEGYGFAVAGVITDVRSASVTGDDGTGFAMHNIYATPGNDDAEH